MILTIRDVPVHPDPAEWRDVDLMQTLTHAFDIKATTRGMLRQGTVVLTAIRYVPADLCLSVNIAAEVTGTADMVDEVVL